MYYHKETGRILAKFSDKNYTLMLGQAGIIPYYSRWKCYDFIGLADKELSILTPYTNNTSKQNILIPLF